ncbi:MAG: YbaB/EbfC family nucleoid-associated protein [Chloroflexi bacterium]|nr:YbaB/EbfC family nucleoid-associated protein [Chloroflexota bacterium]MQC27290.1 YbaB/EbfC family nucleoid-associated protein [Chloroflexota bacterium]
MDNPNMPGMLKQLRQMQKDLVKAQKELAKETVSTEVGGVTVTITGDQRLTDLEISMDLLAQRDPAKLTKSIKEAVNQALEESRKLAQDRLGPLSSGLSF